MQVQCTHCGRPNHAPDGVSGGTTVCAACGRPFAVDNNALARVPLKQVPAAGGAFGSLGQPGGLGGLGDLGPPAPGPDFGSLGASAGSLGDMPDSDSEAFDLSSILSPAPRVPADPVLPGAPPADFTFGGTMDKFSALNLGGGPGESNESTRVVDVDTEAALREMSTPIPDTPPDQTGGWRVRSERGLVYELMTVDAVVAWLEGKADITGVRVARGAGAFQGVEAFSEIATRLGLRPGGSQPAPSLPSSGAGELSLAMERAPSPRRRPSQRSTDGPSEPRADRERREATQDARQVERPVGMGAVLGMLVGALTLAGVAVFVGTKTGALSMPPPLEATAVAPPSEPSRALTSAVEAYEAGKINLAERRLKALAEKGDDPRAWRYLALALHKSNRESDARAALAEYRRRMQQAGGDGRQVREVRD